MQAQSNFSITITLDGDASLVTNSQAATCNIQEKGNKGSVEPKINYFDKQIKSGHNGKTEYICP